MATGALEYSEEDLARLHPDERAALLGDPDDLEDDEDDLTDEERAALENVAGDETEVIGDDPNKEAKPGTEGKEKTPAVETPTEQDDDDEADKLAIQSQQIKVVDKAATQTQIDDLLKQRKDLAAKLQDGDLDFADYTDQTNALSDQIADLKADIKTAENEAARQTSAEQALWNRQCDRFFRDHGTLYEKTGLRFQALNAAVIAIANKPENGSLTGTKILKMAHQQLVDEGLVPAATTPVAKPKAAPKEKAQVPTLAGVPAAEISETADDKFKVLDNLPQDQLEEALAKMSESEQKRYLAGV